MKNFPVNSTSVTTRTIRRTMRVLRRAAVAEVISYGGVYNCRETGNYNPPLWSPHARGDAIDLFPPNSTEPKRLANIERIGKAVIAHATRPTPANFGRPVRGIVHIIFGTKQWVRGIGLIPYSGVPHVTHVHVAGSFSTQVKPPCA